MVIGVVVAVTAVGLATVTDVKQLVSIETRYALKLSGGCDVNTTGSDNGNVCSNYPSEQGTYFCSQICFPPD